MQPFPRSVDELSPEWLNDALTKAGVIERPAIDGFDLELIGVGEGFLGQLARVTPHAAGEAPGLPESLIAKFASSDERTREFARAQNYYAREIGFYRDIGGDAQIPIPRCYFGELDPESNHFALLLEDLRPAETTDQVEGTDEQRSRLVIEAFAALHARWWNSERLAGYAWSRPVTDERPLEEGLEMMRASMLRAETEGSFDRYPEMKALLHYLPPLFRVKPPPPFPYTLVHGDLRSDNVVFPSAAGGSFSVLDWQCCGMDQPTRDLSRWLVQSISIEQRRGTERDLLRHYHQLLVQHGVRGYSFRKLQSEYQLSIVVMYLMFAMGLEEIDTSADRSEALFHAMYSRLDAALVDWKIRRLLKTLPLLVPVLKATTWLQQRFSRKPTR
jgi:thiamine kinase-like enzyme